jgi:hypothetical protein
MSLSIFVLPDMDFPDLTMVRHVSASVRRTAGPELLRRNAKERNATESPKFKF